MRKMILWAIGLFAVFVVLSRSSDIAAFFATLQTGAWLPLVVAAAFEVTRFFSQAQAVATAFEATGVKRDPIKLVPVCFSAMFVNSLAPSGGTAGTLLYIEDARRDGISIARSTPAILLYDVAYFMGFGLLMIIGFIVLALSHALSPYYVGAGIGLLLIVAGLSALLILSKVRPKWVHIGARWCEDKLAWFVQNKLHRNPPKPWGEKIASSFCDDAASIASAPLPALKAMLFMTLTAGLDMLTMIGVGIAFGFSNVPLLVASYVVAQLLTIFSPTPQGVGIVEAGVAVLLVSFGVDLAAATAISLVYRGYVYWIPFLCGALSIRRTKLFTPKEPPTDLQRDRDTAHGTTLAIIALSALCIVVALLPAPPGALATIAAWFMNGAAVSSTWLVVAAAILVLLTRGLWVRDRTSWAVAQFTLLLEAVLALISGHGMRLALVPLAVAVWLFYKRRAFSRDDTPKHIGLSRIFTGVFSLVVALVYGTTGFLMLSADFPELGGLSGAVTGTLGSWFPFVGVPATATEHGAWFISSVQVVGWLALAYAVVAIVYSLARGKRQQQARVLESLRKAKAEAEEGSPSKTRHRTSGRRQEPYEERSTVRHRHPLRKRADRAQQEEAGQGQGPATAPAESPEQGDVAAGAGESAPAQASEKCAATEPSSDGPEVAVAARPAPEPASPDPNRTAQDHQGYPALHLVEPAQPVGPAEPAPQAPDSQKGSADQEDRA